MTSDVNNVIQPVHIVFLFLPHIVFARVFDREPRLVFVDRHRKLITPHQVRSIVCPRRIGIVIRHIGHTADEAPRHNLVKHIRQIIFVKHYLKLVVTSLVKDVVTVALIRHVLDIVDHKRLIAQDLAAVAGHDERVERHFLLIVDCWQIGFDKFYSILKFIFFINK